MVKSNRTSGPGKPEARSIRLLAPGLVQITEGEGDKAKNTLYVYVRVHSDFGTGFAVTPIREPVVTYHVLLNDGDGAEDCCDCPGNQVHGHCKHVSFLRAVNPKGGV
jgi:hypothetical protein